jgi:ABC-type bacteriocin/lantibiotic exporter with double-glycine peptidase domain
MKKLWKLLKDWHDLIILVPSALILFILGGVGIRLLDPTASVVELGVLSVLNWNLFLLLLIGSVAYYLYNLWFSDYFSALWNEYLTPFQGALINTVLWLSTLWLSCFVLLRNL